MPEKVRVRFAPSPTGYLHVGGARTALFNWLFARRYGGTFILRIEDTDLSRSSEEMVEGILQGLRWLGLDWDEGPFYQSMRILRYQEFAHMLLESGHAYRCFCRPEDLSGRRITQQQEGNGAWIYDRRCLQFSCSESDQKAAAGHPFAVRFRVPGGKIMHHDFVFGDIETDTDLMEDFVLLRSGGIPTYHLGVVVDDLDMEITHVIRGADHISNTPKQILLYQAAGRPLPGFAHLPLILGPDKQRLSKRHGATSVMAYQEMGYTPAAFFNFLALLGWSPGDDTEIMSREELVRRFALEGVGKANAVFGLEKLDWFNAQYLQASSAKDLSVMAGNELRSKGLWKDGEDRLDAETLERTLELLRNRIRKPGDVSTNFRAFFTDDFEYEAAAAGKFLRDAHLKDLVPRLLERYKAEPGFTLESTEKHLRDTAAEAGVKAGLLINALRVGLTGQGVAPGLFEVMVVLGRERTVARMERLANFLLTNGE
jgi:glutamyl-tRNA synthetase